MLINSIGTALGAEVTNFDVKHYIKSGSAEKFHDELCEYQLLCFRNQELAACDLISKHEGCIRTFPLSNCFDLGPPHVQRHQHVNKRILVGKIRGAENRQFLRPLHNHIN